MPQKFEINRQNYDKDRREAIIKLAQGFFMGTIGWGFLRGLSSVQKEVDNRTDIFVHEKAAQVFGSCGDTKEIFARLFLGTQERISVLPAQNNLNFTPSPEKLKANPNEIYTTTTFEAAKAFGGMLTEVENDVVMVNQLATAKGEGNIITFGSPTSNLIARIGLRYTLLGEIDDGADYVDTDAYNLKIKFQLNGEEIQFSRQKNSICIREIDGKMKTIPNWGVINSHGANLFPELRDGHLWQDYLVISNLPNMFHLDSYLADRRSINFGGTHREGTKAAQQLFTHEGILKDLCGRVEKAKGSNDRDPYWQAVILVNCNPIDKNVSLAKVLDFAVVEVNETPMKKLVYNNQIILDQYK